MLYEHSSIDMEDLSFLIGVIGNITSVLVVLSPIGTFWRIVKHRSTEEFESLPYICAFLSASLWTYYGITKPGGLLIATVNGFGIVVETVYVTLFLMFAPPKVKAKTVTLAGILNLGFPIAAILVTQLEMEGKARIDTIGFMCAGLGIIAYCSPLAAMKTVVTTKSVEYMPCFLSFSIFLNGGIWAFYGWLVHDHFIGVPNGIGYLLGTAQLVFYVIYRDAKPSKSTFDALEEGWQYESLITQSDQSQKNDED